MTAYVLPRALVVALAAGVAASAGCGRQPAPARSHHLTAAPSAPRTLVLPERVAALSARREHSTVGSVRTAAAGFEQPGSAAVGARIRGLSATPVPGLRDLIREPPAGGVLPLAMEPLAESRSPSGRLKMPKEVAPPPAEQLPVLPPQPTFVDDSLRAPRAEYVARRDPADQPLAEAPRPLATQFAAPAPSGADQAAMQPVAQRALEISNHAYRQAHRGMLYAARAELIQSLQLVAQALDVQRGSNSHAAALAAGLTALDEAQDFAPPAGRGGGALNVAEITRAHRTPVLKDAEDLSPVIAQQQYLAFAQTQLAIATGNHAVASLTLFRLGKVQMGMAQQAADPQMLHGPQAMVYYQAALAADDRNFLAANELGVLMARYGQLQEARRLLVHSVQVQPQVEAWHNLAVVHERLGEADLATRAAHERELLAQRTPAPSLASGNVEWVDAKTFAAHSPGEVPWEESVVRRSTAGPSSQTR